jgi:hypothetical protein
VLAQTGDESGEKLPARSLRTAIKLKAEFDFNHKTKE